MIKGKFNVLIDAMHGSSGKGLFTTYLADQFQVTHVSSSNFPNAGHTAQFTENEKTLKFVAKAIPTSLILKKYNGMNMQGFISPGSGFNWERLFTEWVLSGFPTLFVHSRASVVDESHAARERQGNDSTKHVASTMQGTAAALSDKILRKPDCRLVGSYSYEVPKLFKQIIDSLPEDHPVFKEFSSKELILSTACSKINIIEAKNFRDITHDCINSGITWLHEGSQGYALSIDHGSHYPNCLSKDSRVLMADGSTIKIGELKDHIGEMVPSLNSKNQIELKPIINWWKNPLNDRKWYNIVTETSVYNEHDQQWIGPKFTADHKIKTTSGKKKISDIKPGDKIYVNENVIKDDGLQIFLGSMLGDGCVLASKKNNERAVFQIQHCEEQQEYLRAKAAIMKKYSSGRIRKIKTTKSSFKEGIDHTRYESKHTLEFKRLATELGCYGKKHPNMKSIVEKIDWRGIAIWYQDDGHYKKSSNGMDVKIYTNGFTFDEVNELKQAMKEKFNLNFSLQKQKNSRVKDKVYPVLCLSRKDHDYFFNEIKNYCHPCLSYKLPKNVVANWNFKNHDNICCTTELVKQVVQARDNRRNKFCFDIEVADNHNFFVSNDKGYFNVENCTSRNCTTQAAMDQMAIPPSMMGDIYLNLRTFPIRVGNVVENGVQVGYSGDFYPDAKEITWDDVARISGMPEEEAKALAERERTTVTKRVRRVFEFSYEALKDAVRVNGATKLCVNFIQYLNWNDAYLSGGKEAFEKLSKDSRKFIDRVQEVSGVPVVLIGTGPNHSNVINLM